MRILLADKDPYDLDSMRSELASPGTDVITTRDGREVVRLAAEERPDVVIVASSLGQMGGLAVARELKMLGDMMGADLAPRVIVLLERPNDKWLAEWSRADAWLVKPVDVEQLRELTLELAGTR